MNDDITRWRPDLYQRYELLRRIVHSSFGASRTERIHVIDVGSGPERLTERALGAGFAVIRADVDDFDDPEVVRLIPGATLPFADDSADVVVAIDALPHVPPALRTSFIDECARVAKTLVVIACPTYSEDVLAAELAASGVMADLAGHTIAFQEERASFGLPTAAEIEAVLGDRCDRVATASNAPLGIWASTNVVDFVVNRRANLELESRMHAAFNIDSVVCPAEEAGYRTFFVGSPSGTIDVSIVVDSLREIRPPIDEAGVVAVATGVLVDLVGELEAHVATDSTRRRAFELQIASHDAALQRLHQANDVLLRARASSTEQAAVARRQAAAARRESVEVEEALAAALAAPASIPHAPAPPPLTARRIAGRARRSPRWAARKLRNRYRTRPSPPPQVGQGQRDGQAPDRFDRHWYLTKNPDVSDAGIDPWVHYQHHGRFEARSPHPLFDRSWYVERYPDSIVDGGDPFLDWASRPDASSRDPNEFLDVAWYLQRHPEVADAGLDPVEHYRLHGWREGRRPGPLFDPNWYLGTYPDVETVDIDPLTHYIQFGRAEGRHANHLEHATSTGRYRPPSGLIPWYDPVKFVVDSELADDPHLNVLVPGLGIRHMTGGPNTAIQLAYRLAALGQPVRFIATDAALDDDVSPLWAHMASISEVRRRLPNVEILDGSNRFEGVGIGENDLFMATAWWTAQSIKAALPLMRRQRFIYLIQDFEPLFFASSSQYALALETYELDHIPIVNSQFLLDHLANEQVGRFSDPDFVEHALVFEPTVDRDLFRPTVATTVRDKRRLLFYARPQNGLRNLFELGVAAIQLAIQQGVFDEAEWEFVGMGDPFEPVAVGPRSVLAPAPWRDFTAYAEQMQESDILLSLMLAPHPSYPPLEMAACGRPAVTTVFGPKTREDLAQISANIIGTPATIEGIAQGLSDAVDRLDDPLAGLAASTLNLPATWSEVFESVLPELERRIEELALSGPTTPDTMPAGPLDRYGRWLERRIAERDESYRAPELHGETLFSLMTAVWNTPPEFLQALADSVLNQDLTGGWEWVIIDNGSSNPGTRAVLEGLAQDQRVRIERDESNLGILGGLRSCLERSKGRYVLHVDHDDLLTPDALRILASSLSDAGWPQAFYSDEDKVLGKRVLEPYLKPDWDPVLFSNSCYIAHLCGVDRKRALELDAYLDPATEASPDWDLFMRFSNAGVVPHHISEVLYSWRIHASSTAGNPNAKPYFIGTHRRVLERFVSAHGDFERFDIAVHPDSPDQVDWWIRRRHLDPRPLLTIVVGQSRHSPVVPIPLVDHQIHVVDENDPEALAAAVELAAARGALVHLLNASAEILRTDWYWEALGLFELHPDVAAVGGPVVTGDRIFSAGDVFGFGATGWGSPSRGEPDDARGWFGQLLKQRSVDGIAGDHAVFAAEHLHEFLQQTGHLAPSTVGARFSHYAAARGWRVVYSPLLRAGATRPFEELWTATERAEIGIRSSELASGRNRSRFLSLELSKPHAVVTEQDRSLHLKRLLTLEAEPSSTYHDWLSAELTDRQSRYPLGDEPPSIAIITPVYIGTDASLFAELAASLAEQSHPFHEWVIGLDGEISEELRIQLDHIVEAVGSRVRVVGGTKGGILKTMRTCLDACTADYLVPVDADDLLTHDALAVLASAADGAGRPDLVHSDEDVLDGDVFRDPFLRPDWDPVLHLAGSYVWHALCINRTTALAVDLYGDSQFEWCHDWDTVERIRRTGGSIIHVPEVLYHWRRHTGSSTNTDAPETAQQGSVHAMFERMAVDTGHPERYEVVEFPLWRGAKEFHLRRLHIDPPRLSLVSLGPLTNATRTTVLQDAPYPFQAVHEGPTLESDAHELVELLEGVESDLVWLLDGSTLIGGCDPIWEAVKWFELLPDVIAVCGRSIDSGGTLIGGADLANPDEPAASFSSIAGRRPDDPGPYALALKPHSIDAIDWGSVVARRSALHDLARLTQNPAGRIVFNPAMSRMDLKETRGLTVTCHHPAGRSGLGPLLGARREFK